MAQHAQPADAIDAWPIPDDIECDLPEDLVVYQREHQALPEDVEFHAGFACKWGDRFFIHARATLPLMDLDKGVGFGLWVEVTSHDFFRFLSATQDHHLYKTFKFDGALANHWPGFHGACGLKVVVRTVKVDQKVRICEVVANFDEVDPSLYTSLNMSADDAIARVALRKYLHAAWIDRDDDGAG